MKGLSMITLLMTLIGDDPKEQERFRQFYYKYQEHMYFRARYFMRNEQDALDVMQEALKLKNISYIKM